MLNRATRMRSCVIAWASVAAVALMSGCNINPKVPPDTRVFKQEQFAADAPYSRRAAVPPDEACEAARRVMLGQGYSLPISEAYRLQARKYYKPEQGMGVELALNITCLADAGDRMTSIVFVTAWQDEFMTKRSPVAASVGVPVVGSVSMPVGSTEDALVKVGVQTIQDRDFYERFFARLMELLPR